MRDCVGATMRDCRMLLRALGEGEVSGLWIYGKQWVWNFGNLIQAPQKQPSLSSSGTNHAGSFPPQHRNTGMKPHMYAHYFPV